ncbi:prolyl oligopeptidase family serine peptidase [Amycolatopsis thailandensis]|uniref:prolyl oligopeptidase family serine peptidase n=1 Tax=Amycolatopsis thailandensis TaxID=589330 RepID=UPI0036341E74
MANDGSGTRATQDTDELAGVVFPDPYRWLEEESADTVRWQDEQGEAASSFVRDWPHFEWVRERVGRYLEPDGGPAPRALGDQWIRACTPEGGTQGQVIVSAEPFGEGRVLFDPRSIDAEKPPFLSWISPSPDGKLLAIGVCFDGSERNAILLVDAVTGEALPNAPEQELLDSWTAGVSWLPDSSGFFFTGIEGTSVDLVQRAWLYRRAFGRATVVDVPWLPGADYRKVLVTRDGKHLVAIQRIMNPVPVAFAPLGSLDDLIWKPFITEIEDTVAGYVLGDEWIAVTDVGASRGRVVGIRLDSRAPNDPATWREIVPESEVTLRALTPVGDKLYLTELVDTYSQVRIVDRDGVDHGFLPLPPKISVAEPPFPFMAICDDTVTDDFVFTGSTLVRSPGVYRHREGQTRVEVLQAPEFVLDDMVIEDGWATSEDGTRIPYHLVRRRNVLLNNPRPALMYGYGGFNAVWAPKFLGQMAPFVEAGGVFVHVHLRGGGEFGRDWWEGGRLKNKENCYTDLYAVAEDLIATGVTEPEQLALTGGSNGGLLCGVAATQRPDLWAAVIPRVPLLDLIGACRDGYGRFAISREFGDPDDAEEVRRLAGFSPYQLISDGTAYPAVFIDAGDTDPRCPPWHARKFAARLQAATASDKPVLCRIWRDVGHGWATDREIAVTENAETLAFAMKVIGMTTG